MAGPFQPDIMPVKVTIRYNDVTAKWHVTASRQIKTSGLGTKREITRQSFSDYGAAVTYFNIFWGNA
jgi:hypothetical protein